jgi:hypothetical protein
MFFHLKIRLLSPPPFLQFTAEKFQNMANNCRTSSTKTIMEIHHNAISPQTIHRRKIQQAIDRRTSSSQANSSQVQRKRFTNLFKEW